MKFEETQSALLLAGFGTSSISRFVHSVQCLNRPFPLFYTSKSFNVKSKGNVLTPIGRHPFFRKTVFSRII
jgi:hypothetical protein